MNHITLEQVVAQKEQLPDFARDAVQKAYDALQDLWGYYVCKGKYTDDDAFNANVVRVGLGKPRRFTVTIRQKAYPIEYCEVDVKPISFRLEEFFRGFVKRDGMFLTLKEIDNIIPLAIDGMLNNGNTIKIMNNGEKHLFDGVQLTYEEVFR